jgi:hypothetical protein
MFSLKSWLNRQRPPDDDEQISAYIDGVLDSATQEAFEARMTAEPDLRRRVDVTRQLVQTAAQLPPASLPRNFTLPASMGKPSAPPTTLLWWRVGSALAAAVFVFAVGLDISGGLAPRTAAPVAAPQSFAVQATSAPAATSLPDTTGAASSEMAANAAPTESGEPTPEGTPAPLMMSVAAVTETITETTQAYGGGVTTEPTETSPAISAKQPATDSAEISVADTAAVTQAQRSVVLAPPSATPETPVVAAAPPAEQPRPVAPETPWLRIVAGLALLIAVGTGIAGWARR